MKKRYLLLLLIVLLPVLFSLLGYNYYSDAPPKNLPLIKALLVNPATIAVLGGIVGMLLYQQRAMYWGMVVTFLYSFLSLGLQWGTFKQYGVFYNHTLTTATLLSVVGFVGALFTLLVMRVLRKTLDAVNQPQPERPMPPASRQGKKKPQ
ncbi:hypothetical protein [Tumebacillus flagellatus]|uniref:Uncharacterized protein n=1 Tax=Tumebacillus flagellatus TaxID=1157490 RepID=A0A074LMX4_9BACL|nr:hypothetical protein [Tumebacillus flagellatus]KEO81183.1 hypothetical protein EL26_22265 [Tumebacillus flagellatus]